MGNIVLVVNARKDLIHSCVYVADDIVFAKNGIRFGTPFVFERKGDRVETFRKEYGEFRCQM